ncbi:MAG: adenylosuccinate lyase [Candidatus Binataceae bacterium]|jgi:adenylosuccinate lyase|nr:adenylosuccinate lyase [Candidatus Binataceae bacterium]
MSNDSGSEKTELDEALMAISPVDGRYRSRTRALADYFSEYALIRYRVRAEIEWYLSLAANPAIGALPAIDAETAKRLRALYQKFSIVDARRVKALESETNHDVKALEYFLKEKIGALGLGLPLEMIHFACTSEDINNLAYALILKEFAERTLLLMLDRIAATIGEIARRHKDVAMIARTHGQEASPTTVGKEFAIFAWRLDRQIAQLRRQEYLGKANGAVGNFNAHHFTYPEVDWLEHSRNFVEGLGLTWNPLTTQIESHDFLAEIFHATERIATIMIGFARDVWAYISIGYFTQRTVAGEVGSSVMPHKVNPIDFENCEGNLGLAIAMFQHLAAKLPISRWQRDLSDSTAIRGIGTAFGHVVVALSSLERGLGKLKINTARIAEGIEGEKAWEVVAEAIQTMMRRHALERPYERLKELTRGRAVDRKTIEEFVARLPLDDGAKAALLALEPKTYVGLASELVERFTPRGTPGIKR